MAKSKFITDIPEWFNLQNYSKCKELSNTEWHHQLSHRSSLIVGFEVDGKIENQPLLKEIQKVGLPDEIWYQEPIDLDKEHGPPNNAPYYEALGNHAIRPLQALEMASYGNDVHKDIKQLMSSNQNIRLDEIFSHEPYDHYRRTEQHEDEIDDRAFVTIDMALPDTEILSQVKEFLPKYRKLLNIRQIKNRPTTTVIGKLAHYKVLPYLDLHIWQLEQNVKIKRSVLAGTLFPDNTWGENDLAQKTMPLAMTVIEDSFLSMIENS